MSNGIYIRRMPSQSYKVRYLSSLSKATMTEAEVDILFSGAETFELWTDALLFAEKLGKYIGEPDLKIEVI